VTGTAVPFEELLAFVVECLISGLGLCGREDQGQKERKGGVEKPGGTMGNPCYKRHSEQF
jgi:hypothetical protein